MLHKTRGIVFHVTPYSESSVVAKLYTEHFGLQSYLINSVRSKKSKIKSNLLQPLSLLDMVVYRKEGSRLQRVKEIKAVSGGFISIPFDVMKTSMVMFLNEVLYKSIKEEEANQHLFDFIFHAVQMLDLKAETGSCFHLHFLVQLTKYLGFFPNGNYSSSTLVFNLQEGTFQEVEPVHPYYIAPPLSMPFDLLINHSIGALPVTGISSVQKRELIEKILQYYALHVTGLGNINSNKVLEEVWQ